jgi:hypothetical protein
MTIQLVATATGGPQQQSQLRELDKLGESGTTAAVGRAPLRCPIVLPLPRPLPLPLPYANPYYPIHTLP